jgi:SagB-type dehydrogenase family enzyme
VKIPNPWHIAFLSQTPLPLHPERVGFRTSQFRHAGRHLNPEHDLAALFLANTKAHASDAEPYASVPEYFGSLVGPVVAASGTESVDSGLELPLPAPAPLAMELGQALRRRRSRRAYSGESMSLADLAAVLHAAAGITHRTAVSAIDRPVNYELANRAVPSGGGLYPIGCYCVAARVAGLEPGVYRYRTHGHALARVETRVDGDPLRLIAGPPEANGVDPEGLAAALVLAGNPQKSCRKYGSRGGRFVLLEAGMLAFAANLAATSLGYGTLDFQSYLDDVVERCLGIAGGPDHVLHVLFLGRPEDRRGE